MKRNYSLPVFRLINILFFLLFLQNANAVEACPSGKFREIKEVIVEPAIIEDVQGEIDVIASNVSVERHTPAVTKWVDIPENYIRPETITSTFIHKIAPTYKAKFERHLFREKSYDNVSLINGKIEKRDVPAIWVYRAKYVIDPDSASSRIKTKAIIYDQAEMEKDGKLLQVVEPSSIELLNSSWITQKQVVTHQIRTPATVKEVWGECVDRE